MSIFVIDVSEASSTLPWILVSGKVAPTPKSPPLSIVIATELPPSWSSTELLPIVPDPVNRANLPVVPDPVIPPPEPAQLPVERQISAVACPGSGKV